VAEGVAVAGKVISGGVHDDPDVAPPPSAEAPKGWTWARGSKAWVPKVRGPVVWQPDAPAAPARGLLERGPWAKKPQEPPADPEPPADDDTRDPDPAWMGDDGGSRSETRPIETFKLDPESKADIKALIALAYTVPGETLPLVDPYCFGPLAQPETATGIIDAISDIVYGSPRVAAWAASAAGLMPWIKLGIALKPVFINVLHHHITRSVEVEVDRDAREMTVTRRDYSMYAAA